jgi:anthranilate phosphoribosyltransferase
MKKILQLLFEHKTLNRQAAKEVLLNIGKGVYNEHEITSFMTVYLHAQHYHRRTAGLSRCIAAALCTY